MGNKRRLKKNKQRGMYRRSIGGKRPMSEEQKEIRKKAREAQKEAVKKAAEAKTKKTVKAE